MERGLARAPPYDAVVGARDGERVSLGWTAGSVPLHTHACFYYADETSLRSTLAFLRIGLDAPGVFNVIFADQSRHDSLLEWLGDGYSGDVRARIAEGKLAMVPGASTRGELLANIGATLDGGLERGHRLIRFLGFIAWGAPGWPDEAELLQFESEVNAAVAAYPAVVICTYGVPRLSGQQLIHGGLLTHPVVFLNDRVLENSPLFGDRERATAESLGGTK